MKVKKMIGLIVLLGAFAMGVRADEISYTYEVQNSPGEIGNFSWTIETNGFITQSTNFTGNYFNSFIALSAPSNGHGCGIYKVFATPNLALTTFFSPLCNGLFDSETGGGLPIPGQLGTFISTGTNPDDTESTTILIVTDLGPSFAMRPTDSARKVGHLHTGC